MFFWIFKFLKRIDKFVFKSGIHKCNLKTNNVYIRDPSAPLNDIAKYLHRFT